MNPETTSASPLSPGSRRLPHQNLEAAVVGGLMLLAAGSVALVMAASRELAELTPGSSAVQSAAAPAAALISEGVPVKMAERTWVYIVGSEAEAALLREVAASLPGSPSTVIVAGSRGEAEVIMNFGLGLNPVREAGGQGPAKVVVLGTLASGQ